MQSIFKKEEFLLPISFTYLVLMSSVAYTHAEKSIYIFVKLISGSIGLKLSQRPFESTNLSMLEFLHPYTSLMIANPKYLGKFAQIYEENLSLYGFLPLILVLPLRIRPIIFHSVFH